MASIWAAILQMGYPRDAYQGYSLHVNKDTFAISGITIVIPNIPVTIILDQLILICLNIQQKVSICTSSLQISLDIHTCDGKHPVTVKCAHILLPLVMLVTSTNKSVQHDMHIIHEIGKNGKQYLNIVRVCLHFVQQKYMIIITTTIHTIIIITCTTYSIVEIPFKSSKISSSFGKFIVNSGG